MPRSSIRDRTLAAANLEGLVADLSQVLDARHGLTVAPMEDAAVEAVREALDAAVDALLAVALDQAVESKDAWRLLDVRDTIATYLRAADDVEVSGTRPEVRANLLVRAAEVLLSTDVSPP
jgi:hypothetical protein